jgi:RNA polymerase sigma-70 factor (ECF subfamily)
MDTLIKSANWSVGTPDQVLVEASICGDTSAFGALVQRHSERLLRVAQQVTRNLDDAQEAVQEAFLNAYQKLHQFQGNSKLSTWLIRIVLNKSLLILRKEKRWTARESPLEWTDPGGDKVSLQVSDWHPNPEQLYLRAELRELLRTGLSKLRPILRVVFVLRDIEELSILETAAILNVSSDVVRVRLHRARLELREWLSRYFRRDRLACHGGLHLRLSAWEQGSGPVRRLSP